MRWSGGSVSFQVHVVTDERDLCQYISEDQTPVNCGGRSTHDQVEWVEFYKVSRMASILKPFVAFAT